MAMPGETLQKIPEHLEQHLNMPYGGLFGSSVIVQVVEEIVSDPTMDYRPSYLEDLTGASSPSIRDALATLVEQGLLEKSRESGRHPVYRVNVRSKKFIALSFLAYAVLDDRESTDCMDDAVQDYYSRVLQAKYEPMAMASTLSLEYTLEGKSTGTGMHHEIITSAVS